MDREFYAREYPNYKAMRKRAGMDKNRLKLHLMPPSGWMNDPNGLCQFQGVYHIYFQYTPFLAGWGLKLWGHYTTRDWIHFQEEEPFLFPDCPWDRDGVYSGSAFVKDGELHYFYTGNVKLTDRAYDYVMEGREQNTIHVKSRDGMETGEKQLVLTHKDYPEDMSKHVRDPKIFCQNGVYYMLLGARNGKDEGCVLLFWSRDLEHWSYFDRIVSKEPFGYMWECPDLFELGGRAFLLACPQGLPKGEHCRQNVYQCGYFPIELDLEHREYHLGEFAELDKGFDFYAAQSFEDDRGRRILLGWMGMPDADYDRDPTVEWDWIHAMALPRVLSCFDGKLIQQPLEEMRELRKNKREALIRDFGIQKTEDCCFEMRIVFEEQTQAMALWLREDVSLSYQGEILTLSLGESGYGRKSRTVRLKGLRNLTIFSDTSSIEIFLNDGEEVMTTRVFSQSLRQNVWFADPVLDGKAVFYELQGLNVQWRDDL